MDENHPDHIFKISILGAVGVGKTSILQHYAENISVKDAPSTPTTVVDFKTVFITLQDKRVNLQIWDTAGQERFGSVTDSYYRGAHGVILVYDITNEDSFKGIDRYIDKENRNLNIQYTLVGNKCDLRYEKKVPNRDGEAKASKLGIGFQETSALDGTNIKEVFEELATRILDSGVNATKPRDLIIPGPSSPREEQTSNCIC